MPEDDTDRLLRQFEDMIVQGLRRELYPHPSNAALAMFQDGELDEPLNDAIQEHLESCAACRKRLKPEPGGESKV